MIIADDDFFKETEDLVCVLDVAYGYYNCRLRPAEVLITEKEMTNHCNDDFFFE